MNSTTMSSALTLVDENSVHLTKVDNEKSVRPDVAYDTFDLELPVIDLSPMIRLESLRKELDQSTANCQSPGSKTSIQEEINKYEVAKGRLVRDIQAAAEEYGFFQIINHGISMDLVEQLLQASRPLFDLPMEEKQKFEISGFDGGGFRRFRRAYGSVDRPMIWNEVFELEMPEIHNPGRIDHVLSSLLPEESTHGGEGQQLKSTAETYEKQVSALAFQLLDIMAASIGVQDTKGRFLSCDTEGQIEGRLRINHYPVCAQPELTWGLPPHADPFVLTILHQGQLGPLQVAKAQNRYML